MNKLHRIFRRACAVVIGLVFFLSGVLKLMDPVGVGLIVEEYFKFFGTGFMRPLALPAGLLLSLLEAVTGIALVTGVYRKTAAVVSSAMLVFFTILTAVLWIGNPVMDCGCFGEAVHLTHPQSFFKNVVLIALAFVAFLPFRDFGVAKRHKKAAFWLLSVSVFVAGAYSLLVRPMTDFTQFNLSSKLLASEETVQTPEFVSLFIYEKHGEEGSFTLDRLPDSTWTYVRTETMEKRDVIHETDYPSLTIKDAFGEYCDSLAAGDRVMVVSSYHPEKCGSRKLKEIARFLDEASQNGFTAIFLVASDPQRIAGCVPEDISPEERAILDRHTYYSDYKTLIALNRSNGGAVYFQDGNLIDKWSVRRLPDNASLEKIAAKDATELMISSCTHSRLAFQAFILYSLAIMLLL